MAEVAIIGAGLSGLSLALALHQQNIPCTLYEMRADAPINLGGAVMLSPNALRILDRIGAYSRLNSRGYNFKSLEYRKVTGVGNGEVTETQEFGGEEKYGYDALRVYRTEIIDTLLQMLKEKSIKIIYGKKLSHVVEETSSSVTWEWTDGTRHTAAMLVGADGIHSTVRKYLYPDLKTKFTGMAGITAAVPTVQLEAPADLHMPLTFVLPGVGGFVIAQQQVDGSEVLIGKQRKVDQDLTKEEWARFMADKDDQVRFLASNTERFPEVVRNAVSHIPTDKINVWPFYVVPRLDRWASDRRRVVILGDAAHAIPPSAGQGINQAFEDTYIYALLLGAIERTKAANSAVDADAEMREALNFWQSYRQSRVDQVLELNKQIDLRRMPEGQVAGVEKKDFELRPLFNEDFDSVVADWLQSRQ